MRYYCIFDLLKDLRSHVQSYGLSAFAMKAEEAMRVARSEVTTCPSPDLDP